MCLVLNCLYCLSFLSLHLGLRQRRSQERIIKILTTGAVITRQDTQTFNIHLRVEIFAGIYFRELILIFFLQISLFYADFDGISEKSTFRGYLISRKCVPAKICALIPLILTGHMINPNSC